MYESNDKMVSHPDHYQSENGMEVIKVIEAFTADLKGIEAACTANIIKYACRWYKKNGIQDLEKILWYVQYLIDHLKEKENKQMTVKDFEEKVAEEYIPPKYEIYKAFVTLYPNYHVPDITCWNGYAYDDPNIIKVWPDGKENNVYKFRYVSPDEYSLEEVIDE